MSIEAVGKGIRRVFIGPSELPPLASESASYTKRAIGLDEKSIIFTALSFIPAGIFMVNLIGIGHDISTHSYLNGEEVAAKLLLPGLPAVRLGTEAYSNHRLANRAWSARQQNRNQPK